MTISKRLTSHPGYWAGQDRAYRYMANRIERALDGFEETGDMPQFLRELAEHVAYARERSARSKEAVSAMIDHRRKTGHYTPEQLQQARKTGKNTTKEKNDG